MDIVPGTGVGDTVGAGVGARVVGELLLGLLVGLVGLGEGLKVGGEVKDGFTVQGTTVARNPQLCIEESEVNLNAKPLEVATYVEDHDEPEKDARVVP